MKLADDVDLEQVRALRRSVPFKWLWSRSADCCTGKLQ
jgi:hypothetical protein